MKRLIFHIIPVIILIFSACRFVSRGELDLRLNLQKGDKYRVVADVTHLMAQSLGERDTTISSRTKVHYTYHVLDIDKDGNYDIMESFDKIIISSGVDDDVIEYDSDNPPQDLDPSSAAMNDFMGAEIQIKISPDGEVLEIAGARELMLKLMEQNEDADSAFQESYLEVLDKLFGENGFAKSMNQTFAYLPGKPVRIGDSWSSGYQINIVMNINLSTQYTLKSREQGVAIIDVNSSVSTDTLMLGDGQKEEDFSFSMEGSMTGVFRVDESSGILISGEIEVTMSGHIDVPLAFGMDPAEAPFTIRMIVVTKMEKIA